MNLKTKLFKFSSYAFLFLFLFSFQTSAARRVLIKLATLAPKDSMWYNIVRDMGQEWKEISKGKVILRIYPGGIAGDDPDVVRKMRLGTLHAGVLTAVGIAQIDPAVYSLEIPMMYSSSEEIYYVLEKMRSWLEKKIEAKGFIVLNWADAGWVHFFTTSPVRTPQDLSKLKLFSWAGDKSEIRIAKAAGFQPVPLPATEISTALQTGLVTAIRVSPQVAVLSQYYRHAPYMTDLMWQLLLGATVIKKERWEKIPLALRPALLASSRNAGKKMRAASLATGQRDVTAMNKRGLKVVPIDVRTKELWEKKAQSFYSRIRGPIIPSDAFDLAFENLNSYRREKAKIFSP